MWSASLTRYIPLIRRSDHRQFPINCFQIVFPRIFGFAVYFEAWPRGLPDSSLGFPSDNSMQTRFRVCLPNNFFTFESFPKNSNDVSMFNSNVSANSSWVWHEVSFNNACDSSTSLTVCLSLRSFSSKLDSDQHLSFKSASPYVIVTSQLVKK